MRMIMSGTPCFIKELGTSRKQLPLRFGIELRTFYITLFHFSPWKSDQSGAMIMTRNLKKIKYCVICVCTEHRLIGCIIHLRSHTKNREGKCIKRNSWDVCEYPQHATYLKLFWRRLQKYFFVWMEIRCFSPTECLRNQECNKKEGYRLAHA